MFQVSGQVWPSGEDKSQSIKSLVILNIYKKNRCHKVQQSTNTLVILNICKNNNRCHNNRPTDDDSRGSNGGFSGNYTYRRLPVSITWNSWFRFWLCFYPQCLGLSEKSISHGDLLKELLFILNVKMPMVFSIKIVDFTVWFYQFQVWILQGDPEGKPLGRQILALGGCGGQVKSTAEIF